MAHQFLDGSDIDAGHDRTAAEGMPQRVPGDVDNIGILQSPSICLGPQSYGLALAWLDRGD